LLVQTTPEIDDLSRKPQKRLQQRFAHALPRIKLGNSKHARAHGFGAHHASDARIGPNFRMNRVQASAANAYQRGGYGDDQVCFVCSSAGKAG
jgi:hypothetical protein